jgi:hypothetical protein
MSSVLSGFTVLVKDGKFDNISTPSYYNEPIDKYMAIPFTVVNGVLDIAITNPAVQTFINDGALPNDDGENRFQSKQMGGRRLVTSLGPNFTTYLRNRITAIDNLDPVYSGEITIFVNPVMTKIQLAQPQEVQALEFERVYGVNDYPPTSDEFIGGGDSNNFFTSWVFHKPLTIRFVSSESATGYKYMTFSTHYDGD